MATIEDKPLTPLFLRLTHTGFHRDGSVNLSSVPIYDLEIGLAYGTRKQTIYIPVGGFVDLPIAPRVLLALSEGTIGKFVRDGILAVDIIARFRDFSDCGGAAGAGVVLAAVAPNVERTGGKLCFVVSSGSDSEGFIAGENVRITGLTGAFASLNGTFPITEVNKTESLTGISPLFYTFCVDSDGPDIPGALLAGVIATLPDGKVNVELSSAGSGLSGLGANSHAYVAGDAVITGTLGAGLLAFCNAFSVGTVPENTVYLDIATGHPFFKDIAGTPFDLTLGGGGGGAKVRAYQFSIEKKVPAFGTLFMSYGRQPTSAAPLVVNRIATLAGASLAVDLIDGSRDYDLLINVNGTTVESVTLSSGSSKVIDTSFSTVLSASDEITALLVRSAGAGPSTFKNAAVSLEMVEA